MIRLDASVHADLLNWARWTWTGPWPHPLPVGRAASAEGRWIPPSDLGNEDAPDPSIPVNRDRAMTVQKVYDEILGQQERIVLRAEYPNRHLYQQQTKRGRRFDRGMAARKLGIPSHVYEVLLQVAARHVSQALGGA